MSVNLKALKGLNIKYKHDTSRKFKREQQQERTSKYLYFYYSSSLLILGLYPVIKAKIIQELYMNVT